jgi:LDH2 family malate/lactate/ureidoglycolate dehydrogenase
MVTIKVENLIDPANFFDGEMARYIAHFKDTKPAAGVDAVLIPGEPEAKMRADRTKSGVPLPDDTWAAIVTARDVGVSEVSIQRATALSRDDERKRDQWQIKSSKSGLRARRW